MSVRLMSLVFDSLDLSSTDKLIMLALADHANDEGKSIYPSQKRIALKTGLTRPTVNKHIQALVDDGYLNREKYRNDLFGTLEVSINIQKLKTGGVTENDTHANEGVTEDYRGVSSRITGGVTEDDTNHQLNIINNHQLKKGQSGLFDECRAVYEITKGKLITDPQAFTLMINNFKANGVTAEDYAAAIEAMDADPKYNGSKPTSYEKWAIGYAQRRKNPPKPKTNGKRKTTDDAFEEAKRILREMDDE